MSARQIPINCFLALALAGMLAAAPALADKPSWAGEKGGKARAERPAGEEREGASAKGRAAPVAHFGDQHRNAVREYYGERAASGRCPPGLAKKNNACLPPGQAKKWALGRPLPRDVIFYEVPRPLIERLGPPPSGYRYVRVASDILIIAVGTAMVVDAIQDLSR